MSSRATARDLLYETRGRASYRVVREDPSLPLGMTSIPAMPTEGVLGALRVHGVLGGLLFPGLRDDAWLCALCGLCGESLLTVASARDDW